MQAIFRLLFLAVLLLCGNIKAIDLGDPAPSLDVERWVGGNGTNITFGRGTNTFVILFWETWCDSCMGSLPQIVELQKRTRPKGVVFVGVCAEAATNITSFLENNPSGKTMDFPLAADPQRKTFDRYMNAFGQTTIPYTFVVNPKGIIAWHGRPLAGLAGALDQIFNGSFDIELAKKISEADKMQKKYFELANSGSNAVAAAEIGHRIVRDGEKNPWLLNNFAWRILTGPASGVRDIDLALEASQKAYESTSRTNTSFADTYARALFALGRKNEAIVIQTEAVEHAPADRRTRLEQTLKMYHAATTENPTK